MVLSKAIWGEEEPGINCPFNHRLLSNICLCLGQGVKRIFQVLLCPCASFRWFFSPCPIWNKWICFYTFFLLSTWWQVFFFRVLQFGNCFAFLFVHALHTCTRIGVNVFLYSSVSHSFLFCFADDDVGVCVCVYMCVCVHAIMVKFWSSTIEQTIRSVVKIVSKMALVIYQQIIQIIQNTTCVCIWVYGFGNGGLGVAQRRF